MFTIENIPLEEIQTLFNELAKHDISVHEETIFHYKLDGHGVKAQIIYFENTESVQVIINKKPFFVSEEKIEESIRKILYLYGTEEKESIKPAEK